MSRLTEETDLRHRGPVLNRSDLMSLDIDNRMSWLRLRDLTKYSSDCTGVGFMVSKVGGDGVEAAYCDRWIRIASGEVQRVTECPYVACSISGVLP